MVCQQICSIARCDNLSHATDSHHLLYILADDTKTMRLKEGEKDAGKKHTKG